MNYAEANALVTYARGLDHLVPNTDANVDTWAHALAHVPLEAGKAIVRDFYGRHPDPDRRHPITAAHIRRIYRHRSSSAEAKQRAITTGRRRHGVPAPRRFIEDMQRLGYLTDRDASQYRS